MTLQLPIYASIMFSSLLLLSGGFAPSIVYALPNQAPSTEITSTRLNPGQKLLLEAALQLAEAQNSSDRQKRSIINIAKIYSKLGDHNRAKTLLEQASQIAVKNNISHDLRLADVYMMLGEYEKADRLLRNAILATNVPQKNDTLTSIAILYSQFSDTELVQQRLESIYAQIPNSLPLIPLSNDYAPLRGLTLAYSRMDDAQPASMGLERISQLASSHLISIHPNPSVTADFFANDPDFFDLTSAEVDQRGGLIYGEIVMKYATLFGDIALAYKTQGNQDLAQANVKKAMMLSQMLPPLRRQANHHFPLRLNLAQAASPSFAQELLAQLEAEFSHDTHQSFAFVDPRVEIAIAYSQIDDQDNAARILNESLQHIQTFDNETSISEKIQAHYRIRKIASAYAKIGLFDKQQSLLAESFDTLLSLDISATSDSQVNVSRVKNRILDEATRIYSALLDDAQSRARLMALKRLTSDPDLKSTRVYKLSDLAIAATKHQELAEAQDLVRAAIMAARSTPVNQYHFSYMVSIARAISHLSDPVAIRSGLAEIDQMQTAFFENVDDSNWDHERLNRRLMETYLRAF